MKLWGFLLRCKMVVSPHLELRWGTRVSSQFATKDPLVIVRGLNWASELSLYQMQVDFYQHGRCFYHSLTPIAVVFFFFINVPEIIWNFIQNNIKYKKKVLQMSSQILAFISFSLHKRSRIHFKTLLLHEPIKKRGGGLRNGMLSYFCYILWSLDFNSFLLTKPSSKLSRKRKRKEDKQEAKMKKDLRVVSLWRVLFLWNFVYLCGERGVGRCMVQLCVFPKPSNEGERKVKEVSS